MKMRNCLLLLLAATITLSCGSSHKYESVKGDPLKARIYTLDNGLKVYMSVNKDEPRIAAYVGVNVGGKNDPAETTGLAHYFEHLMFKGTQTFGTQDYEAEKPLLDEIERLFETYRQTTDEAERRAIYRVIDSVSYQASLLSIPNEYDKLMSAIGSTFTNASTGMDFTGYYENVPSNQLENWTRIQADRFKNATIRGFHTELETVYEEKNMYMSWDDDKVWDSMSSALYPNHPYGTQTVIGTQEHLKNPSITNIKEYHKKWYVPNNMAIALSGDFNPDEAIKMIEKYFGDMEPNPDLPEREQLRYESPSAPVVKEAIGMESEYIALAWGTDADWSADADVIEILGDLLYNYTAGIIDLELIQKQKVLSASAFTNTSGAFGIVYLEGKPKTGQTLEEVRDLLLEQVAKLGSGDFDDDLIEATINNYLVNQMRTVESNHGRNWMFMRSFQSGNPWEYYVNKNDRLKKITKQMVMDYASRNLRNDNYAIVYKRQGKDPNETIIEMPEITPIEMNRDMASDFLVEIQNTEVKPIEPVFLDFKKDIGHLRAKADTEVLYRRNVNNDIFELTYVYEIGKNNNPLIPIAFNYMEFLGTEDMSPEEVKKELYKLACEFYVWTSGARCYINVCGLGSNMEAAMEIMEALLHTPRPNEEALENMKEDLLQTRLDDKLDNGANFNRLTSYVMYGPENFFTHDLTGQQLSELTPEDVLATIRTIGDMRHRIIYYGPATEQQVLASLEKHHRIPDSPIPAPERKTYLPVEVTGSKVYLLDFDASQVDIMQFTNLGTPYNVAYEAAINMYNSYFGGGMNSIVFQEMREARGLAYSVNAWLQIPGFRGENYLYRTYIGTQPDKMQIAMSAFDDIINNMPVSENAFNLAKESLLNYIRTERYKGESAIWRYIHSQDLGLEHDRIKDIFEAVQDMTMEDVSKFQDEWVKNRTYHYALMGDIKRIDRKALEQYGPVTVLTQEQVFGY